MGDQLYCIASLKHTNKHHEHITFWGPDWRGYVLAITDERVGKYPLDEARDRLNDGVDCLAVPEAVVKELLSPTPYYGTSRGTVAQWYDIPGPVVDNTRANWNRLIAASLPRENGLKPKPEVFRGQRRSFAIDVASLSPGQQEDPGK